MKILPDSNKTSGTGLSYPVTLPPAIHEDRRKDYLSAVSSLAHEIRNPLANILLSLELLDDKITNCEFIEYKEIIRRSSMRINELILKELQPVMSHKVTKVNHSIHQVLDEALEMAKDSIRLKRIQVQKYYTRDAVGVNLDEGKIKIAFLNIIINAIEAMPAWKGKLKLITSSRNGKCIVTIEDNGVGIRRENIGKLFEPYYTNKTSGIGFGLAATHRILKSNNAAVEVESNESEGTRFIISFKQHKEASRYVFK